MTHHVLAVEPLRGFLNILELFQRHSARFDLLRVEVLDLMVQLFWSCSQSTQ